MKRYIDKKVTFLLLLISIISVALCQVLIITSVGLEPNFLAGLLVSNTSSNVTFTLISRVSMSFTAAELDFGHGYISATCNNCTMHCDGDGYRDATCCFMDWATPVSNGLLLKNSGNIDVNLMLNVTKNASDFLGGNVVEPEFQFKMVPEYIDNHPSADNDDINDSCAAGWRFTDWTDANRTAQYVCGNESSFNFTIDPQKNEVAINVRLVLPKNAQKGVKDVYFTATATSR